LEQLATVSIVFKQLYYFTDQYQQFISINDSIVVSQRCVIIDRQILVILMAKWITIAIQLIWTTKNFLRFETTWTIWKNYLVRQIESHVKFLTINDGPGFPLYIFFQTLQKKCVYCTSTIKKIEFTKLILEL